MATRRNSAHQRLALAFALFLASCLVAYRSLPRLSTDVTDFFRLLHKPSQNTLPSSFDDNVLGDSTALADFCNSPGRPWNPDLIFECPLLEGGIGNVRQFGLTCLRHAIGARGSFVMPRIARRNPADISNIRTQDIVPFSHMFDVGHFLQALSRHCPQLLILDHHDVEDIITNQPGATSFELQPVRDLKLDNVPMTPLTAEHLILEPSQIPPALDNWLREQRPEQPLATASAPIHLVLSSFQVMWSLRLAADPPGLAQQLSRVFRVRPEAYTLARQVLDTLETRYRVRATSPAASIEDLEEGQGFVGVHLRVESDVTNLGWASYELQEEHIERRLVASDLLGVSPDNTILYVASGSLEDAMRLQGDLREALAPRNLTVVTKDDLLVHAFEEGHAKSADIDLFNGLSWDVQALVDLLILESGAAHVFGVKDSSFSWTVALQRAAARNGIVGGYSAECWRDVSDSEALGRVRQIRLGCEEDLGMEEMWRDEWTSLVGDKGDGGNVNPWMWKSVFP